MSRETCVNCGESVAFGSGKFVNRVPVCDDYEVRKERYFYPEGEFMCEQCDPPLETFYILTRDFSDIDSGVDIYSFVTDDLNYAYDYADEHKPHDEVQIWAIRKQDLIALKLKIEKLLQSGV